MVFNKKFNAIESLFAEDEEIILLKIEDYNAGDEQFYLAVVRYCSNNFKILLQKNEADYTIIRISCDRDFVISCESKASHASSFPVIISKPATSFELETITNIPFVIKDIKQICQKMLDATFFFLKGNLLEKSPAIKRIFFNE